MTATTIDPLILDMLEWLAPAPRPYAEVMEAWRTSCPRLTVWEDAVDAGLVEGAPVPGQGVLVTLTPLGRSRLATAGRGSEISGATNARPTPAQPLIPPREP